MGFTHNIAWYKLAVVKRIKPLGKTFTKVFCHDIIRIPRRARFARFYSDFGR